MDKPHIVIVFTGGTISMKHDAEFGGVVPSLSAADIVHVASDIHEIAHIEICEFGRFPGPHMTPQKMLELARVVRDFAAKPSVTGIVVTHGTDTLEETAYFLDCTVETPKPIVVVGAMRNSSDSDWDGPRNLRAGVLIASEPTACGLGVLVCLAETILAASEVSKTDTSNIDTFESLNFGPLGRIVNNSIFVYRKPVHRDYFPVRYIPQFVPIVTCYAGAEGQLLECALQANPEAIVIEAMGVGNVPPDIYKGITKAISIGIPIVLVSRCPIGRVEHIYAYEGAGKNLYEAGVIFADYHNAQKARVKLLAALGAGLNVKEIRHSFEWSK